MGIGNMMIEPPQVQMWEALPHAQMKSLGDGMTWLSGVLTDESKLEGVWKQRCLRSTSDEEAAVMVACESEKLSSVASCYETRSQNLDASWRQQ